MEYNWKAIGKRIKSERENLSLSQEELGEKLYSTRQLVGRWENNVSRPALEDLIELCKVFDCEIGYLLCEDGYTCKTRMATNIKNATGLSSEAIKVLSHIKNTPIRETILSFSKILEHEKFHDLLKAIHLHVFEFNQDRFRVDHENAEHIANALNCKQDEVKKYLEANSKTAIESILMDIVKSIDLGYNKKRTPKRSEEAIKTKQLF